MTEPCMFCKGPLNPHDEGTYKEVVGLVHGRRKDSMTLREDTGRYAHEPCVLKAKAGNAPEDHTLFEDLSGKEEGHEKVDSAAIGAVIEEIFEKHAPPPTIRGLGQMLGLAPVKRCDAYAKKGTGVGSCDTPLDEHGNCPKWRSHIEE